MGEDVRVAKLATVSGLPGKNWGARACLGAALADVEDGDQVLILTAKKVNGVPTLFSANTTYEEAIYMLARQQHKFLSEVK